MHCLMLILCLVGRACAADLYVVAAVREDGLVASWIATSDKPGKLPLTPGLRQMRFALDKWPGSIPASCPTTHQHGVPLLKLVNGEVVYRPAAEVKADIDARDAARDAATLTPSEIIRLKAASVSESALTTEEVQVIKKLAADRMAADRISTDGDR